MLCYWSRLPQVAVLLLCWSLVVDAAASIKRVQNQKDKRKDKEGCFAFKWKDGAPPGIVKQLTDALDDGSGEETEVLSNINIIQRCNVKENKLQNILKNEFLELVEEHALIYTGASEIETQIETAIVQTLAELATTAAQWGTDRIDQRDIPLDGSYAYTNTGAGVRTYVIDTGVMGTHEEFQGATGSRVAVGFSAINDGIAANAITCQWHGTHVSGIAGGKKYGVAKDTTIVPVRVFDCSGSGHWGYVLSGLNWIVGEGQPGVINLSIGGPTSPTVNQKLQDLIAAGYHVVAASGNGGTDACTSSSPNSAAGVLSIGSIGANDVRSSWSNYGACVVVHAPGEGIVSAYTSGTSAFAVASGTSMSSPMAAGVIACYLQGGPVSPEEMSNYIKDTATPDKITNLPAGTANKILYTTNTYAPTTATCYEPDGYERRPVNTTCTLDDLLAQIPAEYQCAIDSTCDFVQCQQYLPPDLVRQLQGLEC